VTDRPAANDSTRQGAKTSDDPLSGDIDQDIEKVRVALSELRTRRDTLPPMSHMFDAEEEPNLDKQIETHQRRLAALAVQGSRKNDLAPVSRLSKELLSAIILYVKWFPEMRYRKIVKMPQFWMCALVSKRWHRVVISTPYLWNMVNTNWSSRKINTWLARSGATGLYIGMDEALKDQDSRTIPRLISAEHSRIRSLRIITSAALMDDWRQVLNHDAPMMEVFGLYITYPQQHDHDCRLNLTFPASYFHGRPPPLLQKFEFSGPHIVWTSPHLCNLTCLRIQGHRRSNRPHVPLAQVLRSLRHLPLLKYLDIAEEAFPDDDDNPQNLVVKVSRLRLLRFRGGFERWCPLLTHLVLPFATEIDLCSTSRGLSDVDTLFNHLAVHFGSTNGQDKFDSVAMHRGEDGLRLRAECTRSTGRPPLHIDFESTEQREETYVKFAAIDPVSRATRLCLTGWAPTFVQWKGIERAMAFLEVLRLGGEACGSFPGDILRINEYAWPFMRLVRIEIEKAPLRALTAGMGDFWEIMGRSVVAILGGQMVGRWWGERLRDVEFVACDGGVDVGFVRLLEDRGIEVGIA
jgi:hypothetical protein